MMHFNLNEKVAVVTGGGRGVGLMAARGLMEAGAKVYVVSRNIATCQAAAEQLAPLGTVVAMGADLSSPEGCRRFANEFMEREDRLHVLVNNAGTAWAAPLELYPVEGWDAVVNLNMRSPFLLVQSLLPALERAATAADPSRVINIGSIDGLQVFRWPGDAAAYAYSVSKAGLHHLTRVLAVDLGARNVTVNAIAPGPFESEMTAAALRQAQSQLEEFAPMGRIGRPEDIAGATVFLSSVYASYITGVVLPVDGGISVVTRV